MSAAEQQPLGPKGHSILGMSVLERRLECPGSARAEEGRPNTSSPAADRGTRIHNAAALALVMGQTGEDVWDEDDEGVEIIDGYIDLVLTLQQKYAAELLVEHEFRLTHLHPLLWGTADVVLLGRDPVTQEFVVIVIDLKTGRWSVPIRRPDGLPNLQLSGYGLGGLEAYGGDTLPDRLELWVYQPANGGAKSTTLDQGEMMDMAMLVQDVAIQADKDDAPRFPGDHCRFCRAASDCYALKGKMADMLEQDFADMVEDPVETLPAPKQMDGIDIAKAMAAAPLIELWLAAVRQRATDLLRDGQGVQGWKLVQRTGNRKWTKEEAWLGEYFRCLGIDPWNKKLFSPAQAEKILKANAKAGGVNAVDISSFVERPVTGTMLVPEADPRPAIAAGVEADFGEGSPLD